MTDAPNPTTAGPADPWPPATQPLAGPAVPGATIPLPGGGRRIPRWVALVAAVTTIVSVGTFVTVLVWPTTSPTDPLGFHPFERVGTVTVGADQEPLRAQVDGDRAYLAAWRGSSLAVTAAELGSGETLWEQSLAGFDSLSTIHAGAGVVRVFGTDSFDHNPRPLVVLDADTGRQLWRRDYYGDDTWYATTDVLVLRDREAGQLRGLEHTSGNERWSIPFPGRTLMVSVDEDLTGRSFRGGSSYYPRRNEQVVLPDDERAARLIDLGSGEQLGRRHNVGDPGAQMLAHEDWFVAADTTADGYQILAYDLTDFGTASPEVIYTGAAGRSPQYLAPCGVERLCLLEGAEGDDEEREQTKVIVLDVAGPHEVWSSEAPGGWSLMPVGDALVMHTMGTQVVGWEGDGTALFDRSGEAVRLNAGNVLIFASELSDTEADLSVAGYAFDSAELTELGQVSQVIGSGCAWGERHLVCPTSDGAGIWRFAG